MWTCKKSDIKKRKNLKNVGGAYFKLNKIIVLFVKFIYF